jgi:hypothetical protein
MKIKVGSVALLMTVVMMDKALAGYFNITPPPIPEFDGSSSIAVIALLASVAALIKARSKA